MKAIIIGAGEVGFNIAKRLTAEKHNDVVLIDESNNACQRVQEQLDLLTLEGSGASRLCSKRQESKMPNFSLQSPTVMKLTYLRVSLRPDMASPRKLREFLPPTTVQANTVWHRKILGLTCLSIRSNSVLKNSFNCSTHRKRVKSSNLRDGKVQLVAFRVKGPNPLQSKPMAQLGDEGQVSGLRFTAIKRKNGNTIVPKGTDYILAGDEVFAIGSREAIGHLLELSGVSLNQKLNRVIIAGSGQIGIYLAQTLEAYGTHVKIIEPDLKLAEVASTIVTGDDENDILACVTAKQYGAVRVLALVQNPRYLPILAEIPALDAIVSRHLTAVGNILRLVRRGDIVSVASLREIDAEVIELVAGVNSRIVHKEIISFRNKFPEDALIGAIVRRDRVIVPTGNCVIQPGDKVIVFSMPEAISSVEKFFQTGKRTL